MKIYPTMATSDIALEKGLPVNVDAERFVLGSILLDDSLFVQVAGSLQAEDFALEKHRRIFLRMAGLQERNEKIDRVTVFNELLKHNEAETCDGLSYLISLDDGLPRISNIDAYVRIVRDKAILRRIIFTSQKLIDRCMMAEEPADDILAGAEESLLRLGDDRVKATLASPAQIIEGYEGGINALLDPSKRLKGISTGFMKLDEMTGGLHGGELFILAARPSMGKAQPLDTPIKTPTGWKRMGDLAMGDELASVDGAPSQVTGIFPRGRRQVFRVTFSDGRSTECCDEHLWRVYRRDWTEPRVLSLQQICGLLQSKRNRGRLWIETAGGDFGHNDPLPLDPWVLGALLGDGSLTGTQVRFSSQDTEILERLCSRLDGLDLKPIGGCDYRIVTSGGSTRAGVQGVVPNKVKEAFAALGLWDLTSENKFIPERYLLANRAARLELLRGLLDTDGWAESWGSVRFATSSKRLAENVVDLVRSLGGICSVALKTPTYTHKNELRTGLTSYVVNIQHPEPATLFSLERKRARIPAAHRLKRLTIQSIETSRVDEVRCITVSHASHLYIAEQYIVTHNTALALNIAQHVATGRDPKTVAVFSLEMSKESLLTRMLCAAAQVDGQKFRAGYLRQEERRALSSAAASLSAAPLYIDDTSGANMMDIHAKLRRLKAEHGLGLVVIDYLQLMSSPGRNENRNQEISKLSRGMKLLSKELDVPMLVLSQLSRAVETRQEGDHRPQLSDLRDSGAIEQDADLVGFIFRPEVYAPQRQDLRGAAELILAKQRNGPTGIVKLAFLKHCTRFVTPVSEMDEEPAPPPSGDE